MLIILSLLAPTLSAATPETVASANSKPVQLPILKDATERQRLDQAVPLKAIVPAKKPRKLLIFELNVGYGGHGSIAYASYAFTLMGQKTGAFETVISRDPSVFQRESLRQFDAVFFNNNVGNLFEDPQLRQSLVEFVYSGGGMLGVHGATVAFTRWPGAIEDWPEFGLMIGGRGANHKESDEHVFIKLDDASHPLNQVFGGQDFDYRDEFFRVHDPYSRQRVRVLLSIDNEKTDLNRGQPRGNTFRADNDYALAWVRNYGRGRVFYCTIAHNPYVFWDAKMLQFYLGAIQFALGDLPAPTTPSAKLTPAVRAQEKLGWRLGLEFSPNESPTLFEAIDKAAAWGFSYLGVSSTQKVSPAIPKAFDQQLTTEEMKQVRIKLDAAGVRLLTYHGQHDLWTDDSAGRARFAFLRKMGFEILACSPPVTALNRLDQLAGEYDLKLAISSRHPNETLEACANRSPQLGVLADIDSWQREGIDPLQALQRLQHRLISVRLADESGRPASSRGADKADIKQVLKTLHQSGTHPVMFSLRASFAVEPPPDFVRRLDKFNATSLELAP